MRSTTAAIILLSTLPASFAKTTVPRGVAPGVIHLYKPASDNLFACLSRPEIKVPFSQVNDDYCDCPDGSDEPGTSACSSLVITPPNKPLPGFYCENKGHIPAFIPFSRVNDGICDYDTCCDGSDEWARVGGVKCMNRCDEIGKEARRRAQEEKILLQNGRKKYQDLIERALLLYKEVQDQIAEKEGEILKLQGVVEEKKKALEQAEVEEKTKLAKTGKGKLGSLITFAKERVEELKDRTSALLEKKDTLEEQLEQLEKIMATFKQDYNPNFNDEGVKRAVKAWEEYLAGKDTVQLGSATDEDELVGLLEEDIQWDEWNVIAEETVIEEIYQIEAYLPPFARSWIHGQLKSLHEFLMENGILAHKSTSDSPPPPAENSVLQPFRDAVNEAERTLNNENNSLKNSREDLTKDYGPHQIFRAMKDVCAEASSGEYTYSYCHIGDAKQKSNKDGMTTNLGRWAGFEKRIDDELEIEVMVIKYENGQRCWNGPARSAYVYLRCSAEEKLLSVIEAEKCVYKFVATSPTVCGDPEQEKDGEEGKVHEKDEL